MRYQEITNIEELKAFMDAEAKNGNSAKSSNATSNSDGIELQWQVLLKRDTWPNMIHGLIKRDEDNIHEMISFWMNAEGQRVNSPDHA